MVFCELETTSSNVDMHVDVSKIKATVVFILKTNCRWHGSEWPSEWRSTERI